MGAAPVIANLTLPNPAASLNFFLKIEERIGNLSPIFKIAFDSIALIKFE